MSFGVNPNPISQVQLRQESYLDKVELYGGVKLQSVKPQPRMDGSERPPELKSIFERAPYQVRGETVGRQQFGPDPKSELGKLWKEIGDKKTSDRALFSQCNEGLQLLNTGYGLVKSPPEHSGFDSYSQRLNDKGQELLDKAQTFDDTTPLGAKMKAMLTEAGQELKNLSGSFAQLEDPRPSKSTIGHFKSLETQAAINVVDEAIKERQELIDSLGILTLNDAPLTDLTDDELNQVQPDDLLTTHGMTLKQMVDGLKLLQQTKDDLTTRRDTFDGKLGNVLNNEWMDTETLSKKDVKNLVGEKPGILDKFFNFLGFGSLNTAYEAIRDSIGSLFRMPPMSNSKATETTMMAMLLSERLKQAGVGELSTEQLEKKLDHEHVQVLSKGQNWTQIDKTVSLTINGERKDFQSTLTPMCELKGGNVQLQPGEGVCCHDGTSGVPVNVWKSELKDDQGNLLFNQIRTGVNCAYEIEDETTRKQVNTSRSMQILESHLNNDPRLYSQVLDQLEKRENGEEVEPIVVRNVWISHLTPDPFRGSISGMTSTNERQMSLEQNEAMQDVSNFCQTNEVFVQDKDGQLKSVKVKYEPIMFSFGVNVGAVGGASPLLGGWHIANSEFNNESMKALIGEEGMSGGQVGGWVGEGLRTNQDKITDAQREIDQIMDDLGDEDLEPGSNIDNQLRALRQTIVDARASNERIRALAGQVQEIWTSGDFTSQGEDPYKMGSRVALLGYELGSVVTSNCKSNKDRNSYGDVHMKDLSISMKVKGELRAPNQPRSREEQLNLRMLSRESGNSELQTLNVGGAGYKLSGVSQVYEEQGLLDDDLGFKGLGSFTKT